MAQEFEPSEQTIRNWIFQAESDRGVRPGVLTSDEREELSRLRRENRQLNVERDIFLEKPRPGSHGIGDDTARVFAFVNANQATLPIAIMCRVLGVSESGFHPWRIRAVSHLARRETEIRVAIRAACARSYGTYSAPRILEDL